MILIYLYLLVVIGTGCLVSCKSNYHTITTMTASAICNAQSCTNIYKSISCISYIISLKSKGRIYTGTCLPINMQEKCTYMCLKSTNENSDFLHIDSCHSKANLLTGICKGHNSYNSL